MVERVVRARAVAPRFGLAGAALMVVVCVLALVLTGAGPNDAPEATAGDTAALAAQESAD